MKKVILAVLVSAAISGNVYAQNTSHIGNQSSDKNGVTVVVGDVENVMGNICNQSGNSNTCNVDLGTVNGNVTIGDGATVIQGGESYDDTEIREAIDKLDTNKSTVITGNWGDSTDTVTNTAGGTNWQGINSDGEFYSENYVDGELKSDFNVDLVTEGELTEALDNIDQTDRTDVLLDDNENAYGATIRDEHGNTIEVLDREVTDQLVQQDINQHEALYGNDDKEGVVNTANRLDEQLNSEGGLVDDVEHNTNILQGNNGNTLDQSIYESKLVSGTGVVGKLMEHDKAVEKINTDIDNIETVNEDQDKAITDNRQNIVNNTITINKNKAEQDAYNEKMSELYSAHDQKINSNTQRIGALEGRMDNVEVEIAGMKKGIAAMAAVSGLVSPKYAGDTTISVGVGYAHNETALALGATHNFTQNFSGKVAVGTDTEFEEVVATGSVGFSF